MGQGLWGHRDVKTTMISTHLLHRGRRVFAVRTASDWSCANSRACFGTIGGVLDGQEIEDPQLMRVHLIIVRRAKQ